MDGTKFNAYSLANLADCAAPDGLDTPGARFLIGVAEDVEERADSWDEDAAAEIADGAVPIYTSDRWATFTDLAAWNEDVTELLDDTSDLTASAGVALYIIAERLVAALHEDEQ